MVRIDKTLIGLNVSHKYKFEIFCVIKKKFRIRFFFWAFALVFIYLFIYY